MTDVEQGQVVASAAEVYERFFVPALFSQWTAPVLDAGRVGRGSAVLDVGCGTGVLAGAAATRVGDEGHVAGVDVNEAMLAVARRVRPTVEWCSGPAEHLPFDDAAFDCVVSQFAAMFFADREASVAEMARVARPGGHLALAVWDVIEASPGYAALADLLTRLFGPEAGDAVRAPFSLGQASVDRLLAPVSENAAVERCAGVARFDSLHDWLHTEIRGWTLAGTIDDDGFERLEREAAHELQRFVGPEGVAFPVSALITSAETAAVRPR